MRVLCLLLCFGMAVTSVVAGDCDKLDFVVQWVDQSTSFAANERIRLSYFLFNRTSDPIYVVPPTPIGLSFGDHRFGVRLEIFDPTSSEPAEFTRMAKCTMAGDPPDWSFEEEAQLYHRLGRNQLIGLRDTLDLAKIQLAPGVYSLRLVYANQDPLDWTESELEYFDASAPACEVLSNSLRLEIRKE